MGFEMKGADDLLNDLRALSEAVDADGNAPAIGSALTAGAEVLRAKMISNASSDPKIISGTLVGSIDMSNVKRRTGGGKQVTIGVHHSKMGAYYAVPVEFGHGGPHPAPAHPFVRPAFDTESDEAYEAMKAVLRSALGR